MATGYKFLPCNHAPPPVVVDYSAQLQQIISVSQLILDEVQNHEVDANIDLSPVVAELNKVIGGMTQIASLQSLTNEQIKASSDQLLARFNALIASIDGFQSNLTVALSAIAASIDASFGDTERLLGELITTVKSQSAIVEVKDHKYSYYLEAGDTEALITIPEGAVEVTLSPYNCQTDYKVDGTFYSAQHPYMVEQRMIGNQVIVQDKKKITLPPKGKMHIVYNALRPIGAPIIEGANMVQVEDDSQLRQILDEVDGVISGDLR